MTTSDYCPSCGSKLHGDESVCPFCGYRLAEFRESLHSGKPDDGKTHADVIETIVAEAGFKTVEVEMKTEKKTGSGKLRIFILALLMLLLIAGLLGYLHFKNIIQLPILPDFESKFDNKNPLPENVYCFSYSVMQNGRYSSLAIGSIMSMSRNGKPELTAENQYKNALSQHLPGDYFRYSSFVTLKYSNFDTAAKSRNKIQRDYESSGYKIIYINLK